MFINCSEYFKGMKNKCIKSLQLYFTVQHICIRQFLKYAQQGNKFFSYRFKLVSYKLIYTPLYMHFMSFYCIYTGNRGMRR